MPSLFEQGNERKGEKRLFQAPKNGTMYNASEKEKKIGRSIGMGENDFW